jgi:V/A-type H+-transporting ATPase subunit D
MSSYKEARDLRRELDQEYSEVLNRFNFALSNIDGDYFGLLADSSKSSISLTTQTTNVLGVRIPQIRSEVTGDFLSYSLLETNYHLDVSLKTLVAILPKFLKLLEIEYKVRKLATEIEKTRRRVNALEYVILPEIDKNIHYIQNKLAEDALQTTVRLMKMKSKSG